MASCCTARWLTGLAEWHEPAAGLFLWIKLKGVADSEKLIMENAAQKQVMLMPGSVFMPNHRTPCPYVRAAFSVPTPEEVDLAIQRLAEVLKEAQKASGVA